MTVSKSTIQRRRKLAGELGPVGAPAKLNNSRAVPIMLDVESMAIADRDGPGTRSATIRAALAALVELESWHTAGEPK